MSSFRPLNHVLKVRCDAEIKRKLERYCEETHVLPSDVCRQALVEFLGRRIIVSVEKDGLRVEKV